MIAEQLLPLATSIKKLKLMPGNPRKGDVDAVARSYEKFGQRKAIVAKRDGTVIDGNHQLLAAKKLGWTEIAVVFTDDDDLTAKAYALAANRTSDLGIYDSEALSELLLTVANDLDLLLSTGYSEADVESLTKPVVNRYDSSPEGEQEINIEKMTEGLTNNCPACGFKW